LTLRCAGHSISGTLAGSGAGVSERIVMIDDHLVDVPVEPNMLVVRNDDRPGMVGVVGTALGEAGLSILSMAVGQTSGGPRTALMVLTTDRPVPRDVIEHLSRADGILAVHRMLAG
ncbi:MAG TPA: ACT domain-containing protein, partial [Acidimicrobiales bacterium]|nr:ACT domain-containing protein [Acidimicrobiales bacterium]